MITVTGHWSDQVCPVIEIKNHEEGLLLELKERKPLPEES
jgi:hypothetical protein